MALMNMPCRLIEAFVSNARANGGMAPINSLLLSPSERREVALAREILALAARSVSLTLNAAAAMQAAARSQA